MKITIEAHGRTYSAEFEDDIGAINQAVRGLLVAVGYHTNTVDDYFPNWEDYQEECGCLEESFQPFISTDLGESEPVTIKFTEDEHGYFNFKNKETSRSFGI